MNPQAVPKPEPLRQFWAQAQLKNQIFGSTLTFLSNLERMLTSVSMCALISVQRCSLLFQHFKECNYYFPHYTMRSALKKTHREIRATQPVWQSTNPWVGLGPIGFGQRIKALVETNNLCGATNGCNKRAMDKAPPLSIGADLSQWPLVLQRKTIFPIDLHYKSDVCKTGHLENYEILIHKGFFKMFPCMQEIVCMLSRCKGYGRGQWEKH